jgi:hypothetical protein
MKLETSPDIDNQQQTYKFLVSETHFQELKLL